MVTMLMKRPTKSPPTVRATCAGEREGGGERAVGAQLNYSTLGQPLGCASRPPLGHLSAVPLSCLSATSRLCLSAVPLGRLSAVPLGRLSATSRLCLDLAGGGRLDVEGDEAGHEGGAPQEGDRVLVPQSRGLQLGARTPPVIARGGVVVEDVAPRRADQPPQAAAPVARNQQQRRQLRDPAGRVAEAPLEREGDVGVEPRGGGADLGEVVADQLRHHTAQPQQPQHADDRRRARVVVAVSVESVASDEPGEGGGDEEVEREARVQVVRADGGGLEHDHPVEVVARAHGDVHLDEEEHVEADVGDRPRQLWVEVVVEGDLERHDHRHEGDAQHDEQPPQLVRRRVRDEDLGPALPQRERPHCPRRGQQAARARGNREGARGCPRRRRARRPRRRRLRAGCRRSRRLGSGGDS